MVTSVPPLQMESWRERGFVPDSDDEGEFDSQDSKGLNRDNRVDRVDGGSTSNTIEGELHKGVSTSTDVEDNAVDDDAGEHDGKHGDEGTTELLGDEENQGSRPMSPDLPLPSVNLPSTPPPPPPSLPNQQNDIFEMPSSSPDVLQFDDNHPASRPDVGLSSLDKVPPRKQLPSDDGGSSPLSSPPSSLGSPPSSQNNQERTVEQPDDSLETLLPPLDIPEDILRELDQPTRRSLRERNPIQLHPYLLEDAQYQRLMKARGVRPVHVTRHQTDGPRHPQGDSQDQEPANAEDPPSSSSGSGFQFPPPSPSRTVSKQQRLQRRSQAPPALDAQRDTPAAMHALARDHVREVKRRKLSHPDDVNGRHPHRQEHSSRPHVVLPQAGPAQESVGASTIWDILPSPPRSGSTTTSSTQSTHTSGFRFPRGFTPPVMTTPITEPTPNVNAADEPSSMRWTGLGASQDPIDVDSGSSAGESSPDLENENEPNNPEAVVRQLQRRIKGVLPASWLRLDLKKQEKRTDPNSRNRDATSSHRTENTKGVAKKITKPTSNGALSSPRKRLTSTMRLFDYDDGNGEQKDVNDDDDVDDDALSRDDGSREELARLVGFEDDFHDQPLKEENDDIPEDNRIDDMLPPVSRGRAEPSSRGEKRGVKRQRNQGEGTIDTGPWKRSRLKRQSRITDVVYGTQRQKRSSPPKPPRLGVLDAPDVAKRPRREQPQFLRVAARQARSRRDGGRQSPNRKFLRLSSRPDTEDANTSLREWRRGTIPQAKPTEARSRPRVRQPLIDLSTNEQNPFHNRYSQNASANAAGDSATVFPHQKSVAAGNASNTNASTPSQISRMNATDKRPVRREQQGNKWVIRRNLAISSLKRNAPRPAVPEVAITDSASLSSSPSLFQKSLSLLNSNYRLSKGHPQRHKPNITLDRFLSDSVPPVPSPNVPMASIEGGSLESNRPAPQSQLLARTRRSRKRPPNRLDLNAHLANDQPSLDMLYSQGTEPPFSAQLEDARPPNQPNGLTSFQRTYTLDFNVVPLFAGTFFHESTFVGSGEFARSLETPSRNLDQYAGHSTVQVGVQSLRWGAWNDAVSSEFGMVFETIAENIERNVASPRNAVSERSNGKSCVLYRSLIEYVIHTLFFIDPIDRAEFARRAIALVCNLNEHLSGLMSTVESNRDHLVRIACYNLVFAYQAYQIACHGLVNPAVAEEASELVKTTSKQLIAFAVSLAGLKEIRHFLKDNKHRERREAGIHDDNVSVDAYVVARHVLRSSDKFRSCFETFIADTFLSDAGALDDSKDVSHLEVGWHGIFTTLPLNEIDRSGITRVGSRFRDVNDNWSMVKRLLHPILHDYNANDSSTRPIPFNNYCRVLFHRCFYLINCWGWRDCKPILDTLFDFFARNTLYNLSHEETFGSPSFLEELDRDPPLDVWPGESCFHIFLKIVGSGLRFMSKVYDKKKIRNFAWRLLPNHGRVYPKEKPLRHEDLDALRNHHDLLCTLYWAVPEGCRPRLEAIRDLVHPASSHQETCNISLRSWARLARFKLSTDEDISGLDPFADWHGYFVTELLKQHSLARSEVENQSDTDNRFSRQMIESTISQNQRQIEALLRTALSGLKSAVQLAPSLEHARVLVSKMPIKSVLGLFNPKVARVNTVVSDALQVVVAYVQKDDTPAATSTAPVSADEDSQEYGDWSAIEAIYGQEPSPPCPGIEHVDKIFRPAVARLVSNCFGEDQCPEDAILLNAVNCWTSVAQVLVKHGLRHWDSYVSHYDAESWATLRATVQTRKFTPLFLANCIDKDVGFLSECKAQVLSIWMTVLVERSSMLKFQHVLTEALLNQDPENPLLKNLPFSRNRQSGHFSITLEDFSQRRLSLISSVLSNMREHLIDIEDAEVSREFLETKQEYKELIERLMASMKANYRELGNGVAAESAHGAYVDFVQCVVGFLQQYTRDISPIDSFFTDPTTFPLPSTDPTYIVARLKSYEPKLSAEKVAKTLIVFIQGVSERAAIDGQQVYLVDQLCASMTDTYEGGNPNRPTLRAVLLQCIFPAYLDTALSSPAAWILSRPILQTISLTFKDLLFNMDTTDPHCVQSVVSIFCSVFQSSYQALHFILDDPDLLKEPSVLLISSSFIEMITSALPVIDYIDRVAETGENIIWQIQAFRQFALFAISRLHVGSGEEFDPEHFSLTNFSDTCFNTGASCNAATITTSGFFREARNLASRELQSYVHESWSRHQGKYYFTRRGGNRPQEVGVDPLLAARLEDSHSSGNMLEEGIGVFLDVVHDLGLVDEQ